MSSIETLEKYAGTRHQNEAAALVLIRATRNVDSKQAVHFLDAWRLDYLPIPEMNIRGGL